VHLLKQQSKPMQPRKERKRYDLYEPPVQPQFRFIPPDTSQADEPMEEGTQFKDMNPNIKSKRKKATSRERTEN